MRYQTDVIVVGAGITGIVTADDGGPSSLMAARAAEGLVPGVAAVRARQVRAREVPARERGPQDLQSAAEGL